VVEGDEPTGDVRSFVRCMVQTPHVSSTVEAEVASKHAQGMEIFLATFVAEGGAGADERSRLS
jgi:hypothetical protein